MPTLRSVAWAHARALAPTLCHFRDRAVRSIGQDRGLPKMGVVINLPDQKIRDIGTGYQAISPVFRLDEDLIAAAPRPVRQNDRSHDDPIEVACLN